jgi:DNA processing protein
MEAARAMGVSQKRLDRIREKCTPAFVREVMVELQKREISAITVWDDDYPRLLREIPQPPWVLYVKGDVSLLDGPGIAVVGTRKPTPYGRQAARMLSEQLAGAGWVVVSGMATGIDSEAHRGALRKNGATVAVLGTGVDVVYPRNNRSLYNELIRHGVVCLEMPPGTGPHPGLFPQRNRIISGLSYGTLVVEAAERTGHLSPPTAVWNKDGKCSRYRDRSRRPKARERTVSSRKGQNVCGGWKTFGKNSLI